MARHLNRIKYLVPAIVTMGFIFFLSHQPGDNFYMLEMDIVGLDKIAHMAIYAMLASAVLYAFQPRLKDEKEVQTNLLTIIICVLYGLGDEFHQSFIPGRFVSFADLMADTAGAVAVCTAWFFWKRRAGAEPAKKDKPSQC